MKKIAIIGSSGGNLFDQGGNDPQKLLAELKTQCDAAGMVIAAVEFIGATTSMDTLGSNTKAALYTLHDGDFLAGETQSLEEINKLTALADSQLAADITEGKIDALIVMSCDPNGVNNASLEAAIVQKLPIAGTGGTSLAALQAKGGNVIAASGTTGTTNRTRAVAAFSALSKYFGMKYSPVIGSAADGSANLGDNVWKRISFRGIMMASLPAFIAMALILAVSKIPGLNEPLDPVFTLLINGIPIVVAAITARRVSGLDEVGVVSGILAGLMSTGGGLIGGLVGGVIAGLLSFYLIKFCLRNRFPATTANIVAGGVGGLLAGVFVYFLVAPAALWLGNGIAALIQSVLDFSPILAGLVAGVLIWPAIMGGVYHAAILPIVMLEMSQTGSSFLGAIDMCGLVMVSAGVTLANVIYPRQKGEATIALPGCTINLLFGTFVEAAYPFMFSDKLVFGGALFAAAVSGIFVGIWNVKGTAYLPAISAPFMSNNPVGFAASMLLAMGLSFAITLIANKLARAKAAKV